MKKIIVTLFFLITVFCVSTSTFAAECTYTASVNGEVSLYLSPSVDSYEVMTIPACSKVNVLEKSGSWGLIEYDNKIGWINMSYTRSSYKKAAEATGMNSEKLIMVKSKSETTALCDVPDAVKASHRKGQAVPNGTVLEIYRETATGWGLVVIDEEYTWINLSETVPYIYGIDVKQYEIYYVYTLSSDGKGVPMWETERANKVCAVIPDCTQLTAREKSGEYIYVSYAGMNGWINSKYTEISLFNAQVQSGQEVKMCYTVDSGEPKKEVDLLSVPSYKEKDGANIIDTVPNGTEVFVLRRVRGDWNLVSYNDKLGWIPPNSLKSAEGEELYTVKNRKELMSMPASEKKMGSKVLCILDEGVTVKKLRTVNTDGGSWALVEYQGNTGWIKVSEDKGGEFPVWAIVLIVLGFLAVASVIFCIIKKKMIKYGKTFGEEIEKQTEKETAEISVK